MGRFMLGLSLGLSLLFAAGAAPAAAGGSGGRYVPVTPARVLDTRIGLGAPAGPIPAGSTLVLAVAGHGGVPASGATAVVLNVTVTGPAAGGFVTVWPGGAMPLASNLNFTTGQTVPNLVEVGLGPGGQVSIFASTTLHLVADVEGWVNAVPTGPDGRFKPLVPARLLDTRTGFGGSTTVGPNGTISVAVLGRRGVPANGASAVVLNITVTNPTAYGYITAWPHGVARPVASNLNFGPGQTVANRVVVMVGTGGLVDLGNGPGSTDLVVDISGWFTDATGSSGALFFDVAPNRIVDTRTTGNHLRAGATLPVQIAGNAGVPAMGGAGSPSAVVANITVTNTTAASYLTVYPQGSTLPLASDLNWSVNATVPNLMIVALGPSGAIDVYNRDGSTDVIVDVVGYYVGTALPPPGSAMASLINQDRAAAGVAPLQWSSCLANVAQGESQRQANAGAISHAGGLQLDLACGYSTVGEDVGYTSVGIDDAGLNSAFMNSPGHRANILQPNFRFVGTAWVIASNGYGYITEEFAG